MIRQYLIILLILVGIFIHPFQSGVWDFIFRFIIFSFIVYFIVYKKQDSRDIKTATQHLFVPPVASEKKEPNKIAEVSLAYFFQNDKTFVEYIIKQFEILDGIIFADNGYLFYRDQQQDVAQLFHYKAIEPPVEQRYPISGLLQIVDKKNELLIENNLTNKENLLNYKSMSDYNPGSFLGLPVSIQDRGKLYFLFDAKEKQHFNPEDKKLLIHVAAGIATFITNRLKAYGLLESVRENEVLLAFGKALNGCATISEAIEILAVQISKYFEASRLTISTIRSESGMGIIKKVVGQQDDYVENKEFQLNEGLTGWVISKQKPYLIEDMEKGEYFIPRYSKNEKTNFGLRSFLGVPIQSGKVCYGALTLEHQLPKKYTKKDQSTIEKFIDIFSTIYRRYRKQ